MLPIVIFVVLACLFGISYYFNSKTPVPKGCEKLKEDCRGCNINTCPNRKEHND